MISNFENKRLLFIIIIIIIIIIIHYLLLFPNINNNNTSTATPAHSLSLSLSMLLQGTFTDFYRNDMYMLSLVLLSNFLYAVLPRVAILTTNVKRS